MEQEDGGYYSANPSMISLNEPKENTGDSSHVGVPHQNPELPVPSSFPHELYQLGPGIQVVEEAQPGPSTHLPVDVQTRPDVPLQSSKAQFTIPEYQPGPSSYPLGERYPGYHQTDQIHPDHQIINHEIQEDVDHSDVDSAYDGASLLGDDTRSLASYITDYRYEHGRRYHAYRDGAYWVRIPAYSISSC
jgi:hypothetical protein